MAVPVALIDLSWVLYKFRFYYKGARRCLPDGQILPTGHVYGTITTIQQLAKHFKAVILCVDSHAPHRYEALPNYKAGRHVSTGDPYEDYKIMTDLLNVIKLCTFDKNVYYIKHEGMESDDIIASWIATAGDNWDLHCYFNDNDILQTKGNYHWFKSFNEPEVDRKTYIKEKYGVDLNYLPIWFKVVRGDSSDGIPASISRFPTKKLISICEESDKECCGIGWFYGQTGLTEAQHTDNILKLCHEPSVSSEVCKVIKDEAAVEAVSRNLRVVAPRILDVSEFKLKRLDMSYAEGQELLAYYEINDFVLGG